MEKTEYNVDSSTSKITGFNITNGARSYTCVRGALATQTIAIPAISNSDLVVVRRKTLSLDPYVEWAAGSRLTSQQLNRQVQQLLRLNQEIIYKLDTEYLRVTDVSGSSAPSLSLSNNLNVNGYLITGLGTIPATFGTSGDYAISKSFLEAHYVNMDQSQAQSINGAKTFTGRSEEHTSELQSH